MYSKLLKRKKHFRLTEKLLFKSTRLLSTANSIDIRGCKTASGTDTSASTVVIGGGIVGTSVAYHLAKQGEKNVVLLEKSELTAGSTWHAAGLTTSYHPSINVKKIHYYSLNLYSKIAAETGQEIGFHQPGSIRIGTTQRSLDEFRYYMSKAAVQQAPMYLMTPEDIKRRVPLIDEDKVMGGLCTPYDGHVDPYSLTQAIAKGARKYGASIRQESPVTSLNLKEDGRWEVRTPNGEILADRVVNAAGFWAKEVGQMAGLDIPIVPIQHQYLVTSTVPEIQALDREFPVLRFLEASCYVRQERNGFLVGPYETVDAMKMNSEWVTGGVPQGFGKELFPSDLDRLMPHLEQVMELLPSFATANIQSIVNGPITYSPDVLPIVGPSTVPNMWLAVGFGYGIVHGGGIGKFLADWIQKGESPQDLMECDPGRFEPWATQEYVFAKVRESYGMNSSTSYPHEERFAGRPTSRVTSAYAKQKERGASMVFDAGWEHPGWFADAGTQPEYQPSFGRTNWHSAVAREYASVTKDVGIIDLSPFAKFFLEGSKADLFLDTITANKLPKLGRSVVTHMLTPSAKVYAEMTVTRTAQNQFFIVTGSGSEIHDLRWIEEHARQGNWNVSLRNVSETLGCLSVAGPRSKELLSLLHPRFESKFPFFTSDTVKIGGIETTALRLTYTGELGWELYHPIQDTGKLYEAILAVGESKGLADFGSLTLNALRLEKGFRLWGKEMNHDRNVVEAGLLPFVDMTKEDFVGKAAIETIQQELPIRDLVMLKIDANSEYDPKGDESIWLDEKLIGNTTSGGFSYKLNQPISFAYLPPFLSTPGTRVLVELMNRKYEAEVLPRPPEMTYNERLAASKLKKNN